MAKATEAPAEKPVDPNQLLAHLQELIQANQRPPATLPPPPMPPAGFAGDEETLYQRIKARLLAEIPAIVAGGPVTVTPPEKLRKDFQHEESERILAAFRGLRPLAKRVLKLVEAIGDGYVSQKAIAERLGRSTGGGSWIDLGKAIQELASLRFVAIKERQGVRKSLRDVIATDLAAYHPADAEVEAVYQSVLHQLATHEQAE